MVGITFPKSLGSSRNNNAVPNPWQVKPTSGSPSLNPQPEALGAHWRRCRKYSKCCQLCYPTSGLTTLSNRPQWSDTNANKTTVLLPL